MVLLLWICLYLKMPLWCLSPSPSPSVAWWLCWWEQWRSTGGSGERKVEVYTVIISAQVCGGEEEEVKGRGWRAGMHAWLLVLRHVW